MPFGQTLFNQMSLVPGAGAGLPSLPGSGNTSGGLIGDVLNIAGNIFGAREQRKLIEAQTGLLGAMSLVPTVVRGAGTVARSPAVQGAAGGLVGSLLPSLFGGDGGGGSVGIAGVRMGKRTPKGNATTGVWLDPEFLDEGKLVFWTGVRPKGWMRTGSSRVMNRTNRCRPR